MGLCLFLMACATPKQAQVEEVVEEVEEQVVSIEEKVDTYFSSLSLKQQVELLLLPAIRQYSPQDNTELKNVTELSDSLKEKLDKYEFGGIILFRENITSNAQTKALIDSIQENRQLPLLIAVDQEGGRVTRLIQACELPGNMAIGATDNTDDAYLAGSLTGSELYALGFHLNFAPVMDINSNPSNPIIGLRSFSDDPELVARMGVAFQKGLQEEGIYTALKHFPGHGDTDVDSHTGLPQLDNTLEELRQFELIPFIACAKEADMIMSAHIQYPQIETETVTSKLDGKEIYLPATLSHTILTDLLREEIGFEGVIVTDSLLMDAIAVHFEPLDVAKRAINAGADLLLMPIALEHDSSFDALDLYIDGIVAMVESGEIPASRIEESAKRILTLRMKQKDATIEKDAIEQIGSQEHHNLERKIAQDAITILESDSSFPITETANKTFAFVSPHQNLLRSMRNTFSAYQEEGVLSKDASYKEVFYDYGNIEVNWEEELRGCDGVLLLSDYWGSFNKNIETSTYLQALQKAIDTANQQNIPLILISLGEPYELGIVKGAGTVLAAFGNTGTQVAEDGTVLRVGPNLLAAMDVVFAQAEAKGKMPLNIYKIEQGIVTEELLYPRGYQKK